MSNCMKCGKDISNDVNIKVFENGAVRVCKEDYDDLIDESSRNYSPRRFRKYLKHHLKS